MNTKLLQKYISGNATEAEKQSVTEWIQESPENMREYMALRKVHDIALWRTENVRAAKKGNVVSMKRVFIEIAKVAAVVAIVLFGSYFWKNADTEKGAIAMQSIYVPAGQRAELTLADGTKVWLNARTTLTFPGEFTGETRNVKIDGEGYFDVSKNAEKPFIVETQKLNIRVLGTEFNVKAYSDKNVWETALLRGSVEIYSSVSNSTMELTPSTAATLVGNSLQKRKIDDTEYFRWREGLICFNNISVKEMFERLELYYGVKIDVKNTKILSNKYTGKFRIDDGVEQVLRVLKLKHRFTYTRDDENNTIIIN